MSLLDFFRKKLLGEANVMQPSGFEPGVNTQGLFGQGGDFGGGLFQNNLSQMNQGEGGLLSNIPEAAILGSAIYGQGIQGKDPFAALLPATLQTAQLQKYMTPKASKPFAVTNTQTGKQELITQAEYRANPNLYSPAKKTPLMAAGETEEQKEIGKAFGKKFTTINSAAESAIKNQSNIATIETLIQQPGLLTAFPI